MNYDLYLFFDLDLKRNMQKNTSEKVSLLKDPPLPSPQKGIKKQSTVGKGKVYKRKGLLRKTLTEEPSRGFCVYQQFLLNPLPPFKIGKKIQFMVPSGVAPWCPASEPSSSESSAPELEMGKSQICSLLIEFAVRGT